MSDTFRDAVLALSPIAYYRLGDTGGTAADTGASGRDATFGGTYSQGQPSLLVSDSTNKCTNFSAGYVTLPASVRTAMGGQGAISVSFLLNLDTAAGAGTNYAIMSMEMDGGSNGFSITTNEYRQFGWSGRSTTADSQQTASTAGAVFTAGNTHFCVATVDYANDEIKLYVDGALVKTQSVTFGATTLTWGTGSGTDRLAGPYTGASTISLDGFLDEVAIYPSELSLTDVETLYAAAFEGVALSGALTLPMLSVAAGGAVGTTLSGAVDFPLFTMEAFSPAPFSSNAIFPLFTADGFLAPGNAGQSSLTFPLFASAGSLTRDFAGNITWPLFTASGQITPPVDGVADLVFPIFEVSGNFYTPASATDYKVWVINTANGLHSTYENWNCYGVIKFNGKWLGLFPDGVYEFIGDEDGTTQIDAKVYWVPSDLGTSKQKRVDAVYLNMRNFVQQPIRVVTITDEQERRVYTKDMTGRPEGLRRHRQLLTRGLQGQTWQFGFENVAGGDFTLSEIEVEVIELQRRLK